MRIVVYRGWYSLEVYQIVMNEGLESASPEQKKEQKIVRNSDRQQLDLREIKIEIILPFVPWLECFTVKKREINDVEFEI